MSGRRRDSPGVAGDGGALPVGRWGSKDESGAASGMTGQADSLVHRDSGSNSELAMGWSSEQARSDVLN